MMALYIREVIPFRFMIKPEISRDGFLFAEGGKPWSTNVLSDILITETEARIGFRMTWQDYRHIAKAIDRKFIRVMNEDVEDEDEDEENSTEVHDIMQGHSRSVGEKTYGKLNDLTRNMSAESMDVFREVSDKWLKWLNLVSRQARDEEEEMSIEEEKTEESIENQLIKAMHDLYGRSQTWRSSEQEKAVISVAKGVSPLFVIFPTGFGKSSTFLLPAMLKNAGVTVVICPLVALASNLLKRCKKDNVNCI